MADWDNDVALTPEFTYVEDVKFDTLISGGEKGKERRRNKGGPFYTYSLTFKVLTEAQCDLIWNFYIARSGEYGAFYWVNPRDSQQYTVRFLGGNMSRQWLSANRHSLTLRFKQL